MPQLSKILYNNRNGKAAVYLPTLLETELKMTPKDKAEQIYIYMNLSFNAAELAICLLHQHCEDKAYWEEVWEALLDAHGCRWQQIEFEHQRQHYIQACTL